VKKAFYGKRTEADSVLTFEITDDQDELEIHCDPAGLGCLIEQLKKLHDSSLPLPRHDHLLTPAWAGHELTEEKQGASNTLLHKVTVRLWP
jgi:hypothetical protein